MSAVCDWMVLCDQVISDTQTNALTLVNCLERVAAGEFPAAYPRFAFAAMFRWDGAAPAADTAMEYRLVRYSDADDEEEILNLDGVWRAGTTRTRVFVNFGVVRLRRVEDLWFRLDHRAGRGRWTKGRPALLQVVRLE